MRARVLCPLAVVVTLAAPSAAQAASAHTVMPGESLWSIAATDGLSVAQLAAANGLSPNAQLITGRTVSIPPQSSGAMVGGGTVGSAGDGDNDGDDGVTASSGTTRMVSTGTASGAYVVQPGDTLSAIAARAGMSVAQLAAANGLDPTGLLASGTVLHLSGGSSTGTAVPVSTTTSSASSQPVGTAAQGVVTNPPYPTPERVSASEIGQIAAANGVSPSLAAAIAWQESGFNNGLVSSADARGVMQILPGTWDWIQRTLTAGTPLAPASAASNVRGGVLLLHSLLNSTGGDPALAAAGYYQGLPSVQAHGMFRDTQRYVNSVLALQHRFGGP